MRQSTKSQQNEQISIADRRSLKMAAKGRVVNLSPQKIQLPIKDTSEGDPSVLSEAKGGAYSDAVSNLDLEQLGTAAGTTVGRATTP